MTARNVRQLFDLTGKTALVTGGSRGLGLQIAHALGEACAKLAAGLITMQGEEKTAAAMPLGRLGDDEDLKGVTLLYASDAGKYITGQRLAVDGGVSVVLAAA